MNKTYKIQLPQNKEAQNIRTNIKDGTIEVEVELKEKWEPRDGEIVISNNMCNHPSISVFFKTPEDKRYVIYDQWTKDVTYMPSKFWDWVLPIRPAADFEKQLLFDALAKEGKMWDAKKKAVVDLPRWRAEDGEDYFCIMISRGKIEVYRYNNTKNCCACSLETNQGLECNCFKTYEAAEKVAEQIREIFKNSKAE